MSRVRLPFLTFGLGLVVSLWFYQHYYLADFSIRPIPSLAFSDGSVYIGPLNSQGLAEGHGRQEWSNGQVYEGEFKQGLFDGKGLLSFADGAVWQGSFKQGLGDGKMIIEYADGHRFEGELAQGVENGQGVVEDVARGYRYEGHFSDGVFSGQGTLKVDGEYQYTGVFANNHFEGQGGIVYDNGNKYRGEFVENRKHGQGIFTAANGTIYQGEFVDNQFEGQGAIFYPEGGGSYIGAIKNWQPHGKGKLLDSYGGVATGKFEEGYLQGKGEYLGLGGVHYKGEFEYGEYEGQGTLIDEKGDTYQGEFSYGEKNGEGVLTYKTPKDGVTQVKGTWRYDVLTQADTPNLTVKSKEEISEFALYHQTELLNQALAKVSKNDSDQIELYTLAVGAYGAQEVFNREIKYVENYFNQTYQLQNHSIYLSNSVRELNRYPMATYTSMQRSLQTLSKQMDLERDILFLYITSHGSQDKFISVQQNGLSLADLTASQLARLLDESAIKWKVIVLSACYSGGFIDHLKDPYTLIMTAAAADRTSFGCADDNDFTYFGEAFFKEALPKSASFVEAFDHAKVLIKKWERKQRVRYSNPQIDKPDAIVDYLAAWHKLHTPTPELTVTPAANIDVSISKAP